MFDQAEVDGIAFFGNYRPQFYFRTTDGPALSSSAGRDVQPGDHIEMDVELIKRSPWKRTPLCHT